jgi:hypothetical protein
VNALKKTCEATRTPQLVARGTDADRLDGAEYCGNNEAFEPYTTNIYLRRTLAGEFVMVNKHLVKDFAKGGDCGNPQIKNADYPEPAGPFRTS